MRFDFRQMWEDIFYQLSPRPSAYYALLVSYFKAAREVLGARNFEQFKKDARKALDKL